MKRATAIAHPNIALAKYWGKREAAGNYPAVPSLSVTLAAMSTRTTVTFDDSEDGTSEALPRRGQHLGDALVLNGKRVTGEPLERVVRLLDTVRKAAGTRARACVESANDFPTASGLASSASGFAALALAATRAAGLDWGARQVSDLARQSSASSARSLFGGFVELRAGDINVRPEDRLAAEPVAPRDHVPLVVLVAVVTESEKPVGSTRAMIETAHVSPYYEAWLSRAPAIYQDMRRALLAKDLSLVCELAEQSALAMHACAMAAGIMYMHHATIDLLAAVRALRARGLFAFATMDAGPHVKVLTSKADAARVEATLMEVPRILRLVKSEPGGDATVVA